MPRRENPIRNRNDRWQQQKQKISHQNSRSFSHQIQFIFTLNHVQLIQSNNCDHFGCLFFVFRPRINDECVHFPGDARSSRNAESSSRRRDNGRHRPDSHFFSFSSRYDVSFIFINFASKSAVFSHESDTKRCTKIRAMFCFIHRG